MALENDTVLIQMRVRVTFHGHRWKVSKREGVLGQRMNIWRGNCLGKRSKILDMEKEFADLTPQLALYDYTDIYGPVDRIGLNSY